MSTSFGALLHSIRYRDALIFQAPSLVGLAFVFPSLTLSSTSRIIIFLLAGFLLMAHIFAFNDWSDRASDASSAPEDTADAADQPISHHDKLWLALVLGLSGLALLGALSFRLLVLGTLILLLGVAYSFPVLRFKGKGIPLLSSFLHIAGSVLTFLLGYALFSGVDARALLIGGYFGLIITAGHLVQEIQDLEGDRATHISTNAVRFGPRFAFLASFSLFTLSFVYLFGLAAGGLIPPALEFLLVFYPVFAVLAARTIKHGLDSQNVRRFRGQYRILFGIIVVTMAAVSVASSWK